MGEGISGTSERNDATGARLYKRKILAQNTGVCMESPVGVGLHLGCGKLRWPQWANIDFDQGDISCDIRSLPFPDNYADAICAIHVIEHFHSWEVPGILAEWRRVLRPQGTLVLELPCMNKVFQYIAAYVQYGEEVFAGMFWNSLWGDQKYKDPLMCHKYGWTVEGLSKQLLAAGFSCVTSTPPRYHFAVRDMRLEAIK